MPIQDKNASGPNVAKITDNSDYTIARKSTPITQGVCPREASLITTHTVSAGVGVDWTCSCGCSWNWQGPLHYEITAG